MLMSTRLLDDNHSVRFVGYYKRQVLVVMCISLCVLVERGRSKDLINCVRIFGWCWERVGIIFVLL